MTKKERTFLKIIEVSLIEFAEKGYELASTNNIYKAANVSKGSIFVYFNSKAELYYEVFKYYLKKLVDAISKIDLSNHHDVFEKMLAVSFWKFEYYAKYPEEGKFILEAVKNPP